MVTQHEYNAARILSILRKSGTPGIELSAEELAQRTGLDPGALNTAVGLLTRRRLVMIGDSLGSAPYTFHGVILR